MGVAVKTPSHSRSPITKYPALDRTRLVPVIGPRLTHRPSITSTLFNLTSIINMRSALIADAIGLRITLSPALPELVNPLRSLLS